MLRGFEIDGNRANQPGREGQRPPSNRQEIGGIGVYNVERWTVENVQAREIKAYAGRFIHARNCTFRDLVCTGSDGNGWSFGLDTIRKGNLDGSGQ